GGLPARRFPRRPGRDRRPARDGRRRLRRDRDRAALPRPRHGPPDPPGGDVIEIGLPASAPVMDGPTIQAAAQQALDGGVRATDVLRTVEAVAATGAPTLVMTYWNPVERSGVG